MSTTKTTTGHTLTIDTARMLLEISGPTETMDSIPDAEIHAACANAGVAWKGEVVDETTYAVSPLPVTRYTQDGATYICAGDHSADAHAARSAAESALRDGETLADDMARVDGCCTWTVIR